MSDAETRHAPADLRALVLAALVGLALLLASACALSDETAGAMNHRVVSDATGAAQGPVFDRASMTRSYRTTDDGGLEQVVARDPTDRQQLAHVRAYLQEEAARFQQGRYDDPAKAHGMEMPGSKDLEAGYARIEVSYAELPNGGQITYLATDRVLVQAVHTWFQRRQMGGA